MDSINPSHKGLCYKAGKSTEMQNSPLWEAIMAFDTNTIEKVSFLHIVFRLLAK